MNTEMTNSSHEEFYKPGTTPVRMAELSDAELETRLIGLACRESEATADVVAHIREFERRRLYGRKSFPSMFDYCTRVLGYSAGAAYLRIYAGRLSVDYPEVLDLLRRRRLHLTAIRTVGPYLRPWNREKLLEESVSKTERELKFLIAETAPKAEPPELVRRLPAPAPALAAISAAEPEPASPRPTPPSPPFQLIEPLTPRRVRFAFNGTETFLIGIDRLRELLKHRFPSGDLESILAVTVEFYLTKNDPARKERAAKPRKTNPRRRSAPQWVKDIVYRRDGGRCAFVSSDGVRCEERGGIEFDHVVPWAKGGPSNDPNNIRLLCRAHNALEAEKKFGTRNC